MGASCPGKIPRLGVASGSGWDRAPRGRPRRHRGDGSGGRSCPWGPDLTAAVAVGRLDAAPRDWERIKQEAGHRGNGVAENGTENGRRTATSALASRGGEQPREPPAGRSRVCLPRRRAAGQNVQPGWGQASGRFHGGRRRGLEPTARGSRRRLQTAGVVVPSVVHPRVDRVGSHPLAWEEPQHRRQFGWLLHSPVDPRPEVPRLHNDRHPIVNRLHQAVCRRGQDGTRQQRRAGLPPPRLPIGANAKGWSSPQDRPHIPPAYPTGESPAKTRTRHQFLQAGAAA